MRFQGEDLPHQGHQDSSVRPI
ncbi:Os04g0565300 [Oryza sativa Japonica Group]|uniref:Os04g0565300 protein n=1 Tax=Oryza sativa subsp. japonica TaxID=39947 RepID=C7J0V7_ORYSJ|nr:Os04g0565300 [Oryza sativa Japonica Group]|eukprot:NP_001174048.1 Os04g0565300 [Oryza sativa Japonica Group]